MNEQDCFQEGWRYGAIFGGLIASIVWLYGTRIARYLLQLDSGHDWGCTCPECSAEHESHQPRT